MTTKKTSKPAARKPTSTRKTQTVGESIIQGLTEAIAWTKGENDNVRGTLVEMPLVDVRKVRLKMRLSQAQFATRFGFPPATLRNWEHGRSQPDTPTRLLLAVIAKHPEAGGRSVESPLTSGTWVVPAQAGSPLESALARHTCARDSRD